MSDGWSRFFARQMFLTFGIEGLISNPTLFLVREAKRRCRALQNDGSQLVIEDETYLNG